MILLLIILAGICNAISEDSNQGHLDFLNRKWWSEDGYKNKYEWVPLFGFLKWSWWPLIIFTDAFHLFKFFWVCLLCYAISFGMPWYVVGFVFALFSGLFEIVYDFFPLFISIIRRK